MKNIYTCLSFLFISVLPSFAQSPYGAEWFPVLEMRMAAAGFDLVECGNERQRDSSLKVFNNYMDTILDINGSYNYPLDSVKNARVLNAPDKEFRIITWTFRYDNDSFIYFGIIQFKDENKERVYLSDSSHRFDDKEPLYKKLAPDNWYGALYYQVVMTKTRGQKYYSLVGWNGNTKHTDKKILDVLYFDKKGRVVFGAPLFKYYANRSAQYRVVWEYANDGAMVLRYEDKKNVITFENLFIPKKAKGLYHLYVPDGTYDYFRIKRGVWIKNEMLFDNLSGATED